MEREQLSTTFGILMAGLLRAERQAGARHGQSGVYRVLPDSAPRKQSRPPAKPTSSPPDSSRR